MRLWRTAAAVAVTAGLVVGGCAAASHISELQPHSVNGSAPMRVPTTTMQLGIDVDWYMKKAQAEASTKDKATNRKIKGYAAEAVSYIRGLHANAISISFPFFIQGPQSNRVHSIGRVKAAPTPRQLAFLIVAAQKAGLTVSLRPLLDESSQSIGESRTRWQPTDMAKFFHSYQHFLRPYLILAQRHGVAEFIEGTEFSVFQTAPGWTAFSKWARTVYHGTLACASNWGKVPARICGGVTETVDAYPPIPSGSLLAGWEQFDQKLKPGTTLTEVGIAAATDARTAPYKYGWPIDESQINQGAQASWFTAACHAAQDEHSRGIYFWSISPGVTPKPPTVASQETWSGGAGARAISSCFAALSNDKRS